RMAAPLPSSSLPLLKGRHLPRPVALTYPALQASSCAPAGSIVAPAIRSAVPAAAPQSTRAAAIIANVSPNAVRTAPTSAGPPMLDGSRRRDCAAGVPQSFKCRLRKVSSSSKPASGRLRQSRRKNSPGAAGRPQSSLRRACRRPGTGARPPRCAVSVYWDSVSAGALRWPRGIGGSPTAGWTSSGAGPGRMDGLALILAAVAVVVAFRQRRRIAALQATLVGLADAVKSLRAQIATAGSAAREAPPASASGQPEADER